MIKNLSVWGAIGALLIGVFLLVFSQIFCNIFYLFSLTGTIANILFGTSYAFVTYFLIYIVTRFFFRRKLSDFGICKPRIPFIWLLIGFLLPIMVSNLLMLLPGTYINNLKDTKEIITLLIVAIFTTGLGAGFAEELVFRGFILHAFSLRFSKGTSIIVTSILFGMMRIGMSATEGMNPLNICMLFVTGTSLGIMFSMIALEYSVWSSAIVHALWNVVMIGKILDIGIEHNPEAAFSYLLSTDFTLFTGGDLGIESSFISIAGYWVVSLFLILKKKNQLQQNQTPKR